MLEYNACSLEQFRLCSTTLHTCRVEPEGGPNDIMSTQKKMNVKKSADNFAPTVNRTTYDKRGDAVRKQGVNQIRVKLDAPLINRVVSTSERNDTRPGD